MVGRIIAPFICEGVHILTPGICKYVTFYGKKDFAVVIKVKNFEMGDYPGPILKSERWQKKSELERCYVKSTQPVISLKMEKGGCEPWIPEASGS